MVINTFDRLLYWKNEAENLVVHRPEEVQVEEEHRRTGHGRERNAAYSCLKNQNRYLKCATDEFR